MVMNSSGRGKWKMSSIREHYTKFNGAKDSVLAAAEKIAYGTEELDDALQTLHRTLEFLELCLREEVYADVSNKGIERGKKFVLDKTIQGTSCQPQHGRLTFNFPLWMFGSASRTKERPMPSWHNGRSYVREKTWWEALIAKLLRDSNYDVRTPPMDKALITQSFVSPEGKVTDLDKYSLTPFINALVHNNIIVSDHPSHVEIRVRWTHGDLAHEHVQCDVIAL